MHKNDLKKKQEQEQDTVLAGFCNVGHLYIELIGPYLMARLAALQEIHV